MAGPTLTHLNAQNKIAIYKLWQDACRTINLTKAKPPTQFIASCDYSDCEEMWVCKDSAAGKWVICNINVQMTIIHNRFDG